MDFRTDPWKFFWKRLNSFSLWQWQILFLILTILRGWDRLIHAQIWAEDGTIFLYEALYQPFGSLFLPYAGYYHTLPRLLSSVLTQVFPLDWVPALIVFVSYSFFVLAITEIIRNEYEWFIPGKRNRLLLVLLITFAPSMEETWGNLANIHWFGLLYIGLLGMKSLHYRFRVRDYLLVFLFIGSEGGAIIYFPLFLYRLWYQWKVKKEKGFLIQEGIILSMITLFFIPILLLRSAGSDTSAFSHLGEALYCWRLNVFHLFFLHPVAGDQGVFYFMKHSPEAIEIILLFFGFSFLFFSFIKGRINTWELLFFACTSALSLMVSLARPDLYPVLSTYFQRNPYWWEMRYSFLMSATGIILWFRLMSLLPGKRALLVTIFSIWYLIHSLPSLFIKAYGAEQHWVEQAISIEQVLQSNQPDSLKVPIYPDGWEILFMDRKSWKAFQQKETQGNKIQLD